MYKIIIVDDEQEVRQGMIKKIPFESLGYEFVGEAENGMEALEVIEQTNPDLGIIDIKMPYMDGIALAEIIYEKYPAMRLIILSGFDEFEFAQQAIKYNVLEYVLKPVSAADVVKLLEDTKINLDKLKATKQDMKRLKDHYLESFPIIRERFLNALVLERHSVAHLEDKMKRYNINLGKNDYMIAIVKPDKQRRFSEEQNELFAFSIYETCKEICEEHAMNVFHNHEGESVIVIHSIKNWVYNRTLEEIRQSIEKLHDTTVTIGVGESVDLITKLSTSFKGARRALNYRLTEGCNRIISIADLEPRRLEYLAFDSDMEDALSSHIRAHDREAIESELYEHFETLKNSSLKILDVKRYITEILMSYVRLSRSYDIKILWFDAHKDIFGAINKMSDYDQIKNLVVSLALELSDGIHATRKNSIRLFIEEATDYMEEHYHEDSISLELLSSRLHISSEYLSRQFKKEMSCTFSQYLAKLRMDAAKHLIEDTNLKNFQIAGKVGYSEPNYFSYAYKKYFGVSPSAYRKSLK